MSKDEWRITTQSPRGEGGGDFGCGYAALRSLRPRAKRAREKPLSLPEPAGTAGNSNLADPLNVVFICKVLLEYSTGVIFLSSQIGPLLLRSGSGGKQGDDARIPLFFLTESGYFGE